jgi:hypothetical protein
MMRFGVAACLTNDHHHCSYLPTTGIWLFAKCQMILRVFFSALDKDLGKKTLGKETLCRMFYFLHLAKSFFAECFFFQHSAKTWVKNTRQKNSLPNVLFFTLGKEFLFLHLAKSFFAECFILDTRQRAFLPSVFVNTRQR